MRISDWSSDVCSSDLHRPLPTSQLWIKPDSRVAPALVTSRTLLDTVDRDLFDRRIQWLLDRSGSARAFRDAIEIIVALRRPAIDGKPFEDKKAVLREEGFSDSRMEKIHAGVYPNRKSTRLNSRH